MGFFVLFPSTRFPLNIFNTIAACVAANLSHETGSGIFPQKRDELEFPVRLDPKKTLRRSRRVCPCFHSEHHHERIESERLKGFTYDDLLERDKVNLDIFWLRDESLEDSANLPDPDVLALEIAEELEAALEQFAAIAEDLKQ